MTNVIHVQFPRKRRTDMERAAEQLEQVERRIAIQASTGGVEIEVRGIDGGMK